MNVSPEHEPVVEHDTDQSVAPSVAVIEAVGAVSNSEPTELPPLVETIDPDALNSLFNSPDSAGRVVFRYLEYTVAVSADRTVRVYAGTAPSTP